MGLGSPRQRVLEAILEQGPVRQSGQLVVECLDEEPFLEGPAGRDIGQRAGHPDEQPRLIVERASVDLHPDRRPVGAGDAQVVPVFVHDARSHGSDEIGVILAIVGVDEVDDGPAEAVRNGVTRQLLPCPIEQRPAAIPVDPEDHLADILDDGSVAGLTVAQCLAGGLCSRHSSLEPSAVAVQDESDEAR